MKHSGWRKRLFESTRGQILQLLRARDYTVNELAAELKLTDNAVRAHLLGLERDGLVHQSGSQPGFRKPHTMYALATDAEQIFPKAYGPLLDRILTVFSRKLTPRELQAGMREVGRKVADEHLPEVKARPGSKESTPLSASCRTWEAQPALRREGTNTLSGDTAVPWRRPRVIIPRLVSSRNHCSDRLLERR